MFSQIEKPARLSLLRKSILCYLFALLVHSMWLLSSETRIWKILTKVHTLLPATERTPPSDPCFPSPCGTNAECRERNGAGTCSCLPGFEGNPYEGCRRECEINRDCAPHLACQRGKCVDPCPGTCGTGAVCAVVNHVPTCSCIEGYSGDPFYSCKPVPVTRKYPYLKISRIRVIFTEDFWTYCTLLTSSIIISAPPRQDPCYPSPCGPNSQCRVVNEQAVCSCLPTYIGAPPSCRPECVVSAECPENRACVNAKCADPCPNTCGIGAVCTVRNHNPICACPPGHTGDPFARCSPIRK